MSKDEEAVRPGGARQEIALLLRKGFARHQAGDLAAAMTLYRQALAIDPKQPDALNLAGVAAAGLGEKGKAADYLAAALAARPDHAEAHCNYANVLQSSGRLKEAHHHFYRAIALRPRMAMAHRNLGNLCRLMGTRDEAVAAYQRAIEINGEDPEVLCYLGDLLDEQEKPDAAIACYRRAMAAGPDFPRAALNLSVALQRLGRLEEALAAARKAVAVAPGQARAHYTLGCILQVSSHLGEAAGAYQTALKIEPRYEKALYNFGMVLQALGQPGEAAAAYRQLLEVAPQHRSAGHMLNAATGRTTAIAPAAHIREIFDAYSERFEGHLVETLGYDAPQALRRVVDDFGGQPRFQRALDLGCGTGLVARQFQDIAGAIDGVDLAPKMVELARASGLYDAVEEADLITFLKAAAVAGRHYDLVLSADVFIYIGDLAPIFEALARVMPPGGLFALSVECLKRGDYALLPTGRYAQSEAHLRSLAAANGFSPLGREAFTLRKEWDQPIPGLALLLTRDPA
jgi:predicted TPR repeat methyltransferase